MKRPTVASLKKVTPDNLVALGAERLADILVSAADSRPELKRWLRMELAAAQGAEHLWPEIDKRLATLEASRAKVSWRKRADFIVDLDLLRRLIAERLGGLDAPAAYERLLTFLALARRLHTRVRDKDGELDAVFARAAADLGVLIGTGLESASPKAVLATVLAYPVGWSGWLAGLLEPAPAAFAKAMLDLMGQGGPPPPAFTGITRQLADAAGDIDAFRGSFGKEALHTPAIAAEVARRLLDAGRVEDAGAVLKAAGPDAAPPPAKSRLFAAAARPRAAEIDFDWETVWIDYLDRAGRAEAAQAARWASFERTLSIDRARAFTKRLADFDDVEAEGRAFAHAAAHPDFLRGLRFLMEWPALPEAATMIQARSEEAAAPPEEAELWAARLRARQPDAAHTLLRMAAAAVRRRDPETAERLMQEADAIAAA